jgi:MFS superfamily sulfate permease-like transporter
MDANEGIRKRGLAIAMLIMASVVVLGVLPHLKRWYALSDLLRAMDAASLIAAAVLLVSGVLLWRQTRRSRAVFVAGAGAALVLGAQMVLGTVLGVIPCWSAG